MPLKILRLLTLTIWFSCTALAEDTLKYEQKNFSGGLNTETKSTAIAENESPDCGNVLPYEEIGIAKRKGYTPYINCNVGDLKDAFSSTTGWTGSTDVSSVTLDTTDYKEGTSSVMLNKSGTTEAFGSISKTVSLDLSNYSAGNAYALFYAHSSYTSSISSIDIILKTDNSNYKTWNNTGIVAGWNKLTLSGTGGTVTGTMNWTSITSIVCKVNTPLTTSTFDDCNFDCLMMAPTNGYIVRGLHQYKKTDLISYVLCSANTNLYKADEGLGMWIPIYTSLTADQNTEFLTVNGMCYISNGIDANKKFDGTNFYAMGTAAPAISPNYSTTASGYLGVGTYKWRYTYYNSTHSLESNPSPAFSYAIDNSSTKGVVLSFTASADSQVDKVRFYRTTVDGGTYLYEGEVDDTAGTFPSTKKDESLGLELDDDNGAPPVLKKMVNHKNRIFAFGNPASKHTLYVSNTGQYENFDTDDSRTIGTAGVTEITGVEIFINSLIIFSTSGIYVAEDSTFSDMPSVVISKANTDRACYSYKTIAPIRNLLMFLSKSDTIEGFLGAETATVYKYSMLQTASFSDKIETLVEKISENDVNAIVFDDCYIISAPLQNTVLYYDYNLKSWWKLSNMPVYKFAMLDDELLGTMNDGMVYKLFTGTNDNGSTITAYWYSKYYDFDYKNQWKRLRRLYFNFASEENNADVDVDIVRDYGDSVTEATVDLTPDFVAWGENDWGEAYWAGMPEEVMDRAITEGRFKTLQIRLFNDDLNEEFKFLGMEVFYIPKNYYSWEDDQ